MGPAGFRLFAYFTSDASFRPQKISYNPFVKTTLPVSLAHSSTCADFFASHRKRRTYEVGGGGIYACMVPVSGKREEWVNVTR
jgi:hypothetical protein